MTTDNALCLEVKDGTEYSHFIISSNNYMPGFHHFCYCIISIILMLRDICINYLKQWECQPM